MKVSATRPARCQAIRGRCALLAAVLMLAMSCAFSASLEDEYKKGEAAWRSGDMAGAMGYLRPAADRGHAPSQALLGDILDKAEFNEEAVAYLRKAAEQGNAEGQYGLGAMYLAGEGVKRDVNEALVWFTRAAEKNQIDAIKGAAQIHLSALAQADQKNAASPAAIGMIRRAAESSYLPAIDALAKAYRGGDLGLAVDPKQAEAWEAKARELRKGSSDRKRKR